MDYDMRDWITRTPTILIDGMKTCTKCNEIKHYDLFPVRFKNKPEGIRSKYMAYCKSCAVGITKEYRERYDVKYSRQGKHYEWALKSKYNLSRKEYEEILINQNNLCAICKTISEYKLVVDHDHSSNKVRGILCRKCNLSLGFAQDDISILKEMINYLEFHHSDTTIQR